MMRGLSLHIHCSNSLFCTDADDRNLSSGPGNSYFTVLRAPTPPPSKVSLVRSACLGNATPVSRSISPSLPLSYPRNAEQNPTKKPTKEPTTTPTLNPSLAPTLSPTLAPTLYPTLYPSEWCPSIMRCLSCTLSLTSSPSPNTHLQSKTCIQPSTRPSSRRRRRPTRR